MKDFESLVKKYEKFISIMAHKYAFLPRLDYKDFKQVGRITLYNLYSDDEHHHPSYVRVAIKHSMLNYLKWMTSKTHGIITYADSLSDVSEHRHLITLRMAYENTPSTVDEVIENETTNFIENMLLGMDVGKYLSPKTLKKYTYKPNTNRISPEILSKHLKRRDLFNPLFTNEFLMSLYGKGEYNISKLLDFGITIDEINYLVDEGILLGKKVFLKDKRDVMGFARMIRDEKYRSDEEFRKRYRETLRKNWDKALEKHKKLLEESPEYRELTLRNLEMAVRKRIKKYRTDKEYRSRIQETIRKNQEKAVKSIKEKLEKDEEFFEHMQKTRRQNIAEGRKMKEWMLRHDLEFALKYEKIQKRLGLKLASHIKEKRETDKEFREHMKSVFSKNIKKAIRAHKEKLENDTEYRKMTMENLKLGRLEGIASAKAKTEQFAPRREKLLNDIIIPKFGDPYKAYTSEVIELLEIPENEELRSMYEGDEIFDRVRWDIRVLRKKT